MSKSQTPRSAKGLDLMLTTVAVVLGLFFLPMILEMTGGGHDRAVLLAAMVLIPMTGLAFVHLRDGAPRSAPVPIEQGPPKS